MRSKLCTIHFILNTIKKDRDGFPIYVRITYDRRKVEIATGEYCTLDKWKEKSECTKNDERTNEQLHFIKNELIRIKRELEQSSTFVSAKLIKDTYLQLEQKVVFTEYFQNHINKIEQLKEEFKPNTIKVYKTALKHLEAHQSEQYPLH